MHQANKLLKFRVWIKSTKINLCRIFDYWWNGCYTAAGYYQWLYSIFIFHCYFYCCAIL